MSRTILFFLSVSILFISDISAQNWQKVSNVRPFVNYIYTSKSDPNIVYVAADNQPTELYFSDVNFPIKGDGIIISKDGGKTFTDTAMTDKSVYCITKSLKNPDIIIASARQYKLGQILFSWDNGLSWEENSDRCQGSHQIMKIANRILDDKELFLTTSWNTVQGYRYSDNFFDNCSEIPGLVLKPHDIKFSTLKKDWVFMTGDNITQGKILRSFDNGKTFEVCNQGLEGLRVLSVLPSGVLPNVVYCGADSIDILNTIFGKGIYISVDTGRTWKLHSAIGASVYDLKEHPKSPYIVAAAGGNAGIWVSGNGGNTFAPINEGFPENASLKMLEFKNTSISSNGFELFAAVYGDGLYYRSGIIVSVDDNNVVTNDEINKIYPQPAKDRIYAEVNSQTDAVAELSIFDITGTKLLSKQVTLKMGTNLLTIDEIENYGTGYYILSLNSNNKTIRKPIVISK